MFADQKWEMSKAGDSKRRRLNFEEESDLVLEKTIVRESIDAESDVIEINYTDMNMEMRLTELMIMIM